MESKEYKFLETSWIIMISLFNLSMVIVLLIFINIEDLSFIDQSESMNTIISLLFFFLIPLIIVRVFAFSTTTIKLNKNKISVNRSSLVNLPIKTSFQLKYSEIKKYEFHSDIYWYWLKITDNNGKKYRIWKFSWINNKEYKRFRDRFNNEMIWYNEENKK